MRINRSTIGDTARLELNGALAVDSSADSATALRTSIDEAIRGGFRAVVLGLSLVESMDAMGLGEIVRAFNTVVGHGGRLTLSRPTPRVDRLLSITKVRSMIEVVSDQGRGRHLCPSLVHGDRLVIRW